MTPTIIPADQLARAMDLLTPRPVEAKPALTAPDRQLLEAVVGSACLGPVARDEYLDALALATAGRPDAAAARPLDSAAWEALLRDGLTGLSDQSLLTLAASQVMVRGLQDRVDAALSDGVLSPAWLSLYKASAAARPNPRLDQAARETFAAFNRLQAEWGSSPSADHVLLARDGPPLHMAAAEGSETIRFHGADGTVLEVYPSLRPGLSELSIAPTPPPGETELLVDGVPVPLVSPFDRSGFATVPTLAMTSAIRGRAQVELRLGRATANSIPRPLPEDHS